VPTFVSSGGSSTKPPDDGLKLDLSAFGQKDKKKKKKKKKRNR